MNILVENLEPAVQEFAPVNVKRLVKVPKTYQNIFSNSVGCSIKGFRDCHAENEKGITANK